MKCHGFQIIVKVPFSRKDRLIEARRKMEHGITGQRAVGVVYNPEYEMYGNYVPTNLTRRYDVFLHIDKTTALHPLHMSEQKDPDLPETYPYGL